MKQKKLSVHRIRTVTQIFVFVLVLLLVIGKWLSENDIVIPVISDASLHAICPFGGVVTIYQFVTEGTFIQKIHNSSFILMSLSVVVAVLFGAIFCGYICPFGTYQEWIGKLGKRLFPKRFNHIVPRALDRILRYLRYVVLVLVVYQTAKTALLMFQNIDPYFALFNFFTNEVAVSAYIILGVMTVMSLFIERPWCKYLCPYGALLGIFNTFRLFKIKRNKESCISCGKCDKACPMNIDVSKQGVIRDHQCISCHRCTSEAACPVGNTVTISIGKEVAYK